MAFDQPDTRTPSAENDDLARDLTARHSGPVLDDLEDIWLEGLHPAYRDQSDVTQYVSVNSHFSKT